MGKDPIKKIKVTIIVRTFNSGKFVKKALKSIFDQDVLPETYEVLIIDNGSSDNTLNILDSYRDRIRVLKLKKAHYVRAINFGIKNAKGKLITLLDADDTFEQGMLSQMSKVFDKRKGLDFAYCDYYEKNLATHRVKRISLKDNIFQSTAGGIMFKKAALKKVGMYDESLVFPEYDILFKLKAFKRAYIPKPLFTYYRHKKSITANGGVVELGKRQLFEKYGVIENLRDY